MNACTECQEYVCVDVYINQCEEGLIKLPIEADQTGEWYGMVEFNGTYFKTIFNAEEQYYVLFPAKYLNEHYKHKVRIYNPDGILFGCFVLSTNPQTNIISDPITIDYEMKSLDITITEAGNIIKNNVLADKIITDLSTNGQSYNSSFWDKPTSSDTLTSDVLTFYIGQLITITYK